jgi:uncharacterized protein (DUF1330 family)
MPAYVIFIRDKTRDAAEISAYKKLAGPSFEGHAVHRLALGGRHEVLEGPAAEAALLLEFPTFEDAKAWYQSPAYQEASKLRHQGGDYRVIVFEGV